MSFQVGAEAYGAFMGRFSEPLAVLFADQVGVRAGLSALDVGCGTGALTALLVDRLGVEQVSAVDPSSSFVEVMRSRFPALEVRPGRAEELPFPDASADLVLAQLVVHFMHDPVRGIAEMARVARPGGTVAVNVWDHAGGAGPLAAFWDAVRTLDPEAPDESDLPGVREGHLAELFEAAGLPDPVSGSLTVEVGHESFDQWWQPFTLGVGPAGSYVAGLDSATTERLRLTCRELLPDGPFRTVATAWTARATVPQG